MPGIPRENARKRAKFLDIASQRNDFEGPGNPFARGNVNNLYETVAQLAAAQKEFLVNQAVENNGPEFATNSVEFGILCSADQH